MAHALDQAPAPLGQVLVAQLAQVVTQVVVQVVV